MTEALCASLACSGTFRREQWFPKILHGKTMEVFMGEELQQQCDPDAGNRKIFYTHQPLVLESCGSGEPSTELPMPPNMLFKKENMGTSSFATKTGSAHFFLFFRYGEPCGQLSRGSQDSSARGW